MGLAHCSSRGFTHLSLILLLTPASVRVAPVSAAKAADTRYLILSATCRWPAAGPIILPPLKLRHITMAVRRVAARRPPDVGLPRAALPATWRWWRTLAHVRSFLSPMCCAATNAKTGVRKRLPPAICSGIKPDWRNAVGNYVRRHKRPPTEWASGAADGLS